MRLIDNGNDADGRLTALTLPSCSPHDALSPVPHADCGWPSRCETITISEFLDELRLTAGAKGRPPARGRRFVGSGEELQYGWISHRQRRPSSYLSQDSPSRNIGVDPFSIEVGARYDWTWIAPIEERMREIGFVRQRTLGSFSGSL